jgi:hypothetical protein
VNRPDCADTDAETAAAGARTRCGTAARAVHSATSAQFVTRTNPVSQPAVTEPPVRRPLCSTRAPAHRAHAQRCPSTASTIRTS